MVIAQLSLANRFAEILRNELVVFLASFSLALKYKSSSMNVFLQVGTVEMEEWVPRDFEDSRDQKVSSVLLRAN